MTSRAIKGSKRKPQTAEKPNYLAPNKATQGLLRALTGTNATDIGISMAIVAQGRSIPRKHRPATVTLAKAVTSKLAKVPGKMARIVEANIRTFVELVESTVDGKTCDGAEIRHRAEAFEDGSSGAGHIGAS